MIVDTGSRNLAFNDSQPITSITVPHSEQLKNTKINSLDIGSFQYDFLNKLNSKSLHNEKQKLHNNSGINQYIGRNDDIQNSSNNFNNNNNNLDMTKNILNDIYKPWWQPINNRIEPTTNYSPNVSHINLDINNNNNKIFNNNDLFHLVDDFKSNDIGNNNSNLNSINNHIQTENISNLFSLPPPPPPSSPIFSSSFLPSPFSEQMSSFYNATNRIDYDIQYPTLFKSLNEIYIEQPKPWNNISKSNHSTSDSFSTNTNNNHSNEMFSLPLIKNQSQIQSFKDDEHDIINDSIPDRKSLDSTDSSNTLYNSSSNFSSNDALSIDKIFNNIPNNLVYPINNGNDLLNGPNLILEDASLWNQFHLVGNEMIITKSGRCLFPTLRLRPIKLDPNTLYCVALDIVQIRPNKFKFKHGRWVESGSKLVSRYDSNKSKTQNNKINSKDFQINTDYPTSEAFVHSNNPQSGAYWMKNGISFAKVKLSNRQFKSTSKPYLSKLSQFQNDLKENVVNTNNNTNNKSSKHLIENDHFFLHSFHQYQPRIHIINLGPINGSVPDDNSESKKNILIKDQEVITFTFDETKFTAVTHYQNEQVNQLKKNYNPHAKGFKDMDSKVMASKIRIELNNKNVINNNNNDNNSYGNDNNYDNHHQQHHHNHHNNKINNSNSIVSAHFETSNRIRIESAKIGLPSTITLNASYAPHIQSMFNSNLRKYILQCVYPNVKKPLFINIKNGQHSTTLSSIARSNTNTSSNTISSINNTSNSETNSIIRNYDTESQSITHSISNSSLITLIQSDNNNLNNLNQDMQKINWIPKNTISMTGLPNATSSNNNVRQNTLLTQDIEFDINENLLHNYQSVDLNIESLSSSSRLSGEIDLYIENDDTFGNMEFYSNTEISNATFGNWNLRNNHINNTNNDSFNLINTSIKNENLSTNSNNLIPTYIIPII